jgi:hypothetical protein
MKVKAPFIGRRNGKGWLTISALRGTITMLDGQMKARSIKCLVIKGNDTPWDKAIADLERHLVRIKAALSHAKEMKKTGEPWPCSK